MLKPPRMPGWTTGRETYSDVLPALSQAFPVGLDLLVDTVADAFGVCLTLEAGDALMVGI